MGHSRSRKHATNDAYCVESMNINFVRKNVQSVRAQSRFEDFLAELDDATFDVCFLSETWRDDTEEFFVSPKGAQIFLSGSTGSKGVGICISKDFRRQLQTISFHAYSNRLCSLHCEINRKHFHVDGMLFPNFMGSR